MRRKIEKHGGKIILPRHSWDELHRRLHSSLQEPECAEINSILRDLFLSTVDEAERSELCRAYKESLDVSKLQMMIHALLLFDCVSHMLYVFIILDQGTRWYDSSTEAMVG